MKLCLVHDIGPLCYVMKMLTCIAHNRTVPLMQLHRPSHIITLHHGCLCNEQQLPCLTTVLSWLAQILAVQPYYKNVEVTLNIYIKQSLGTNTVIQRTTWIQTDRVQND